MPSSFEIGITGSRLACQLDPAYFKVKQVTGVMDDAHGIGFRKTDAERCLANRFFCIYHWRIPE